MFICVAQLHGATVMHCQQNTTTREMDTFSDPIEQLLHHIFKGGY